MVWFRSLGSFEWVIIGLFIGFYAIYLARTVSIARKMKTTFMAVFNKTAVRVIYMTLFIIALLGPSFGEETKEVKAVGKDIFVCVDLSGSMDAFDIPPTRLEKVKFELKNIVQAFSSDRIGLIIFSSEAFVQCPLTFDQSALMMFIETLNTDLVPNEGTDFKPPLKLALDKLTEEDKATIQNKSKVIVLISDGEDFGEDTNDIVRKIKDEDIRLFTLGVGTAKGSRIRQGRAYKTDKNGREVITQLNSKELRSLAIKTGGQYFEISEKTNDVNRLINSINQIEGEVRDTRMMSASSNKYYYFLLAGLLLVIFDVLVSVKTIRI